MPIWFDLNNENCSYLSQYEVHNTLLQNIYYSSIFIRLRESIFPIKFLPTILSITILDLYQNENATQQEIFLEHYLIFIHR